MPFIMLPLHVCRENSATQDTIIISQHWDRDARLHVRFQILLYRVCQERLLDFTMNWQRCRERVWACDSSDVRGPCRQPGSVLIASLPAPWLNRFPSRLIFQLSIDAAHSASSRPAPPRPLNIHTLAMRYFSTVPQALCPGYSLSLYRRPSRFSPQPSFSSPPSPPSLRRQSILSDRYLCIHLSQSVWLRYRSVKIRFIIRHESVCLLTVYCGGHLARDVTQAGCWLAVMNQAPTFDQLSPSNPNYPTFHTNHICPTSFTQRSAIPLIRFKDIFRMIKMMPIKGAIYTQFFYH